MLTRKETYLYIYKTLTRICFDDANAMVNGGCLKGRGLLERVGTDGEAEAGGLYEATQGMWGRGRQAVSQDAAGEDSRKDLRQHGSHGAVPP